MTQADPRNLEEAKERLREVKSDVNSVIKILTAEQAIKAQQVIREARRRRQRNGHE